MTREPSFPQCGYYKRRLVRGGPWVAARIWCEREVCPETGELAAPERMRCEVDGQISDAVDNWTHLTPISRDEYEAILHRRLNIAGMMTPQTPLDLTRRPIWPS
ncbi:hypothetical protein [Pseudogemmobacter sonorensis]|uniref:hypothetical protein n=1 Tax=Pseudogemmobacter sonorensis TaxID=2989681 RepID=UPI0036A02EF1